MPGKQGFASMNKKRHIKLASKGGKTTWVNGTAHRWTIEECIKYGKIGGKLSKKIK